jgi:glycosyltransferase involved in cell wall biosynthesis
MTRPRVLLIAEAANPEMVSVPLEGWSHAAALTEVADVHLVTQVRNREAIAKAGWVEGRDFTAIDTENVIGPAYRATKLLRGGGGSGWTLNTAVKSAAYPYFEWRVWKHFKPTLKAGEYDIVHRLTPLSPTAPSLLAKRCRRLNVPFILGPLNGGLPWPWQFDDRRRAEREWLSYIRGAHRLLPGYRATRRHASAIIVGSRATQQQIPARHQHKTIYIPENAVDPKRFDTPPVRPTPPPLQLVFLGRLVPYKGPDMLLEAAKPLLQDGLAELTFIGDGPMRNELEAQARHTRGVTFTGKVPHTDVQARLARAHVLGLPSIREFGGAVVLEAMTLGVAPVVVDYGGPGELVTEDTGVAIPMGSRDEIVSRLRDALTNLCEDPARIDAMGQRACQRVERLFTWPAKAGHTREVYRWVLGERADKPAFDFASPEDKSGAKPLASSPEVVA